MNEEQKQQQQQPQIEKALDKEPVAFSLDKDYEDDIDSQESAVRISLDTPFSARGLGESPKSLDELLVAMQDSWQSEETAELTYMYATSDRDEDTVDSRILIRERLAKKRREKKEAKEQQLQHEEEKKEDKQPAKERKSRRGGKRPSVARHHLAAAAPIAVQ
mmetsp:Transcript_2900/g.6183  ORF Transcript_2900/g.6183 Transcript_2900/m.6183 type:complete len:162 (-) Transcript_2900:361-846(-)|eukprot:CAMPEP_0168748138 /NCGR_PEP_ID=MMETSP0724-20121128/16021_1 /TAXON_ID=265536 /ORGANISM="Amphiprora sp., Strain CCMP467" /LENGTH=161 /DNA_ID=CAMNT_0008795957 /DNA_START=313 /DNA_END=798 /DNA_ORIENTATION=+